MFCLLQIGYIEATIEVFFFASNNRFVFYAEKIGQYG
jgi:hypothetical protein